MHGEIEEGAVIYDKATGKSRGYGFITYKHMESAHSALRGPSKLIDVSNNYISVFSMLNFFFPFYFLQRRASHRFTCFFFNFPRMRHACHLNPFLLLGFATLFLHRIIQSINMMDDGNLLIIESI